MLIWLDYPRWRLVAAAAGKQLLARATTTVSVATRSILEDAHSYSDFLLCSPHGAPLMGAVSSARLYNSYCRWARRRVHKHRGIGLCAVRRYTRQFGQYPIAHRNCRGHCCWQYHQPARCCRTRALTTCAIEEIGHVCMKWIKFMVVSHS